MSLWKKENSKKVIHSCRLCPQKTLHYGLNLCPSYVWKKNLEHFPTFVKWVYRCGSLAGRHTIKKADYAWSMWILQNPRVT